MPDPSLVETWRAEAHCEVHGIERIASVRTFIPYGGVPNGYTARVEFGCGKTTSIITTALNMHTVGALNGR